ncbi:hypothetical protein DXG01_013380 [Tephrocybe rancida]|nr:hypothetical protein DXG01_013380 [Tephrocybe rancida]
MVDSETQAKQKIDAGGPTFTPIRTSTTYADVVFQSRDGMRFSIHRTNLETHTGGFPPSEFKTLDEVVHLTEDAVTMDLLFQFVYPRRLPDVNMMCFEFVFPLAEAAEKYEVFSAMYARTNRLRTMNLNQNQTLKTITFGGQHDYPEIIGRLAPSMIDVPLAGILNIFYGMGK